MLFSLLLNSVIDYERSAHLQLILLLEMLESHDKNGSQIFYFEVVCFNVSNYVDKNITVPTF